MFIAEEHGKVVENVKRLRSLVTSQRESKSPDEFLADNCDKTHRLTILAASEARRKPLVFATDALPITLYIESECHLRRFLAWAYRRRRGNGSPVQFVRNEDIRRHQRRPPWLAVYRLASFLVKSRRRARSGCAILSTYPLSFRRKLASDPMAPPCLASSSRLLCGAPGAVEDSSSPL